MANSQLDPAQIPEIFDAKGYCLIPRVIDPARADSLYQHLRKLIELGLYKGDRDVPDSPSGYANPLIERVLNELRPSVEAWSGRPLFPTYSYFRVYKQGDSLRPHRDRPACEISLSVSIGFVGSQPWPLFIEGTEGPFAATMEPGDGLLYKGRECTHWREPFAGTTAAQVFLHYVDRDGPYQEWRYDKRKLERAFSV